MTTEWTKRLALSLSLSLLLGMAWMLATQNGWAATTPVQVPQSVAEMKILYSAKFNWKGSNLIFDIAALAKTQEGQSRFVAFIKNGKGETEAQCERTPLGVAPFDVNSMTLTCEGKLFGWKRGKPGKTTAKFAFADSMPQPVLTILQGAEGWKKSQEIALEGI